MKKLLLIMLAVQLCLSLTACREEPKPTETTKAGTTGATNATDGTGSTTGFVEVQKPDTLPASGWVTRSSLNTDPFAFTENGCYYLFNQCIYFLDTATGYSVGLCSKPGCLHGESTSSKDRRSCDAYIPGSAKIMFFHEENLYYLITGEYGYELYARSLDGTNLRKIGVLGSQYTSKDTSAQISTWVYGYGKLYYTVNIDSVTTNTDGSYIYESAASALVMFDLSSGKEELLLRSEDEQISLYGASKDMALFRMSHRITLEEMQRPDYNEYVKQFPAYLRLWHQGGNGICTLCVMDRTETGSLVGFADGKLHVFGGTDTRIYAYDFASMTFGESGLPEGVNRIWSEEYGGVKWKGYFNLKTGAYCINEYDTMDLPDGIKKFGASPSAFGEHGFIVEEFYSADGSVVFTNTVYFPFEKMNDGMQLSDRIIFMRRDDGGYHLLQPED